MPHKITTAQRKHLDYLRQRGLRTSLGYERALKGLRAKEVKRVLTICADSFAPENWPAIIQANVSEEYFTPWEVSLFRAVGVPMAKTTARDLAQAKAAEDDIFWEDALTAYAKNRAGSAIVSVNGTLKESLLEVLRKEMEDDPTASIEALTKRVFRDFQVMDKWMVRRIAQTESMVGMAQAADYAAQTLDVKYTKIWAISWLGNTRDTHYVMDNVEVDQNEPFELEGGQVMYPHDTSLGAAAAEIINCACACLRRPK